MESKRGEKGVWGASGLMDVGAQNLAGCGEQREEADQGHAEVC